MFSNRMQVSTLLLVLCLGVSMLAGQSTTTATNGVVPTLASFSGVLSGVNGKPLTRLTGVTFSLYKDSEGGAPLWMELQNVQPDKTGHYTLTLGSTTSEGLPISLFASGEARWLGVQPEGQEEQPRVLLLSVPYALKAEDAETLGGLPPSAFMLAPSPSASNATGSTPNAMATGVMAQAPPASTVTGSGTVNFIPLWTSTSNIGNSVLFQSGTGSTAKIGINNSTPASTLDVKGGSTIRGLLSLPATGTATATAGKNSQPATMAASAFNSSTSKAVIQTFEWQAEPAGNNTANPVGTLNLLFGAGSSKPVETGLNLSSNGQITFAPGQTFPGTGNGTITGVIAGTDLAGGGDSGDITLNVDTTKVPQLVSNNSFTGTQAFSGNVGIGTTPSANTFTPLSIGGGNSFGTWLTLGNSSSGGHTWNILSAGSGNSEGAGNLGITDFTGTSTIFLEGNTNTSSLTASGAVNAAVVNASSSFQLGGNDFARGSFSKANAFLGFSGNVTTTGANNVANGLWALVNNTTGAGNTANGYEALVNSTTGEGNTANGEWALINNVAGSFNTALGFLAGPDSTSSNLTNATAIGAQAQVTESNALVLGSISGVNGATTNTLVGIGTTAPTQSLEVDRGNSLVRGTNNFQINGDTASLFVGDTNNFIRATFGTGITLGVFDQPTAVQINQYSGFVGIGTTSPDSLLTVNGSADKPGGGSWGTFSDARLKTLDGNFNSGLSQILKLHPVRYRYKAENAMGIRDRDEHVGFVAQEVRRAIPEAVTENSKGYLLVNNDPILWTMLNAIKEQQLEITALRARLQMSPSSTARPAVTPMTSDRTKDQELRTVRRQLNRLLNKDNRLEARLARLERTLDTLSAPANTLALASSAKNAEEK